MKNKIYHLLTQVQRYHIPGLRKAGMTLRDIACDVGVHFSTVSPELTRNKVTGVYFPQKAQCLADYRRKTARISWVTTCQYDTLLLCFRMETTVSDCSV